MFMKILASPWIRKAETRSSSQRNPFPGGTGLFGGERMEQ
jgi:hypothetical protein